MEEQLKEECARIPSAEELDQALALLDQARWDLRQAEEEQKQKLVAEQTVKLAWSALEEKSISLSADLP